MQTESYLEKKVTMTEEEFVQKLGFNPQREELITITNISDTVVIRIRPKGA
jgi:hypothetical protein